MQLNGLTPHSNSLKHSYKSEIVTSSSTRLPERIKTTKLAQEAETIEIKEEQQVESRKMHRLSDLPNGSLTIKKKKIKKSTK